MKLKLFPEGKLELYTNKSPNEIQARLLDYYYPLLNGKITKRSKRRNYAGAGNHFGISKEITNSSRTIIKAEGFILYQKEGNKILIRFTAINSFTYFFIIFWATLILLILAFLIYASFSAKRADLFLLLPVCLLLFGYATIIYLPFLVSINLFKKEIKKVLSDK
jgi:hypothetical protein